MSWTEPCCQAPSCFSEPLVSSSVLHLSLLRVGGGSCTPGGQNSVQDFVRCATKAPSVSLYRRSV